MKKAFKELVMRERGLLALLCVLAGCASPDMEPSTDMAQIENAEKSRNYVIEQITFRHGKDKVVFRDLSDPSYVKYVGVAPLSMGRHREEDFWQEAELRRVAEETLGRAKMFSEKSPVLEKNSALPRICIEVVEQEYVTDGKNSRTTSYYALELSVKVFSDGQSDAEECFMGSASVKEHTSWGTMSFRPIQPIDLYRLFSEALAEALRTGTWSEVKQPGPRGTLVKGLFARCCRGKSAVWERRARWNYAILFAISMKIPEIVGKMTRIGNTAVHAAQEENRRKGIPNVYVLNGTIVWQLPDGSVTTKRPDALLKPDR